MNKMAENMLLTLRLLIFRLKQLYRVLKSGGLSLWMVATLLVAVLYGVVFSNPTYSKFVHYAVAGLVLVIESVRNDKKVAHLSRRSLQLARVLEYVALFSLVCGYFWIKQDGFEMYNLGMLVVFVPFIESGFKYRLKGDVSKYTTRFVPINLYELRSSGRKYYLLLVVC